MVDQRPTPEEMLEIIGKEEEKAKRGKLKIFFGYAAGVGKTYAMLKAARNKKSEGEDIVCGYIQPHSRPATTKLMEGLEIIPALDIEYKGIHLQEMNLDAILERNPSIVLVDEYAHTNVQGSRHEKRYQDVEEILHAGIDVYTTVNVQHIESLCDIVASITGVVMKERIPDRVFDMAEEVQLVDIEPMELLNRLKAGKVYKTGQAKNAMNHFFTEEKLTALRELALRRTADRVSFFADKAKRLSGKDYFTEEKIIVGLSSSPSNPKIIRTAARMAKAFGGEFIAIFVETPAFQRMSMENQKRLKDNIRLAEQLGAKIETITGEDIPFIIGEYARISGVSKIILGRSNVKRRFFTPPTFAERLSQLAPNLDIYIIPDSSMKKIKEQVRRANSDKLTWGDVLKSIGLMTIATIICSVFYELGFSEANIITVYILSVLISGILTANRIFPLVLSLLSVLIFTFLFTEPRFTLMAYDTGYPVTIVITFLSAFISSNLAHKMKSQAKSLASAAYRTKVLFDTNQLIQDEKDLYGIGRIISSQLSKLLERDIVFYLGENGQLKEPIVTYTGDYKKSQNYLTESEKAVAHWVFQNEKRAGASTGTLGDAKCYYLAIRNLNEAYGVVGIGMNPGDHLEALESNLLFSILSETATAMEKEVLRRRQEEAKQQANSEKLRANLLRSISHDLRTPLTSISGNADMLLRNDFTKEVHQKICKDMYEDSMWLINLVENLLHVTRIEDGTMKITMQVELLEDILREALKHVNRKSEDYIIRLNMRDEMQLVKADSRLIVQVVINIIDNAIKYTPVGSEINITTRKVKDMVEIDIQDNGGGISDENKSHIFEMFYTTNSEIADSRRSLGLGLALCKSIITAHGGTIVVFDHKPHGSVFRFTLQSEEVKLHE